MKIFVSIASYRDVELPLTIQSLLENADKPENLHIGVVQQSTRSEKFNLTRNSHVSEIWMNAASARGAGFARSQAQALYLNEDFFLQIDSHTRFDPHWDTELLSIYNQATKQAGTDKVILSQFPKAYIREGNEDIPINSAAYPDEPMKQIVLWAKKKVWSALRLPLSDPMWDYPEESETVLAGFIFAPGRIVSEVPYDPEISFFGEELCFAIRAWTRGYRIYSPNKNLLSHFYTRRGHSKVWDAANNPNKKWGGLEKKSMDKQAAVYNGEDLGLYGAYNKQSLADYYDFIRQDVAAVYNEFLFLRGIESKTQTISELTIEGITPSMSIPCMDEEHGKCIVNGCECDCHTI